MNGAQGVSYLARELFVRIAAFQMTFCLCELQLWSEQSACVRNVLCVLTSVLLTVTVATAAADLQTVVTHLCV